MNFFFSHAHSLSTIQIGLEPKSIPVPAWQPNRPERVEVSEIFDQKSEWDQVNEMLNLMEEDVEDHDMKEFGYNLMIVEMPI